MNMRIGRTAIVLASILFSLPTFSIAFSGDVPDPDQEVGIIGLRKVDGSEMALIGDRFTPAGPLNRDGLMFTRTKNISGSPSTGPLTPDVSLHYQTGAPPKGSDAEGETFFYDYPNGSKLNTPIDTVQGSLAYDSSQGGTSDWIDWYKFSLTDIDPSPGASNGARNITFQLNSYQDGSGGYTLYEYALTPINETTSTLSEDYADVVDIQFLYYDPWNGRTYIGGWSFFYDDMDDSDGWSWRSNWTVDYVAPVPSTGPEDHDGFANGLSEVGWYYVGIALNWYEKSGAPDRGSFGIMYDFTIDSTDKQNTDQGANTIDTSGPIVSGDVHRIFSRYNNVDWYQVEGGDPSKLWNMTFNITRTGAVLLRPTPPLYFDPWLHTYILWHNPGPDDIWGNDDDGMYYYHFIFSAYLSGAIGDAYYIGGADQWARMNLRNDWLEPDKREVYFGFYSEPVTLLDTGDPEPSSIYPSWFALSEYKVDIDILEESPNRAPSISQMKYSSDWVPDPNGGNLDSVFTFDVTYSDPDNDPPESLFLQIDPDTADQMEYDLLAHEVNGADKKYSDGKDYRITLTGEQIGEGIHDFSVETSDTIPIESLRTSIMSGPFYRNDTLKVWDDYPVGIDPDWKGVPPISEDEPPTDVQVLTLGSVHGPFMDPEDAIISVMVWDDESGAWALSTTGDVVKVDIIDDGGFIARIATLPDMNGKDTFKLKASDDHSSVERSFEVTVDPLNDLPLISSVQKGGKDYSVSMTDSGIFVADMKDDWVVYEDKELEFSIIATDVDLSGSFLYSYIEDISDSWDSDPDVDTGGVVTMTPRDQDLKRSMMAFSVSDGTGTVQLRVEIKVLNTNDPPTIAFRVPPKTDYSQGEKISMRPIGEDMDIDSGDKLTYSVNMENDFGSSYPSIQDQLGLTDIPTSLWSMDLKTGEFLFELDDQAIWGYGPDREKVKSITVAFKVMDLAGASAIKTVELTLSDVNEGPSSLEPIHSEVILEDMDPSTPYLKEYLKVHLWITPATDPDGDVLVYTWDLGDGTELKGTDINHTYATAGTRTVRVWAYDGEFDSDIQLDEVTTYIETILPPEDPEKDGLPVALIVIIALVIMAIVAAIAFFILRSRPKAPPGT
jgi:hypothetical protein